MNRFSFISLLDKAVTKDKNILILDTCCVLDVIRCIPRGKLSLLETVIKIINLFDKEQNQFEIILPSLFEIEWSENYKNVREETNKYIKKCDADYKKIIESFKTIFLTEPQAIYFSGYNLDKTLLELAEKLIELSMHLESIDECNSKATKRVVLNIPPAAKGKNSTKDCIIFEETLYLSEELRRKGFNKKIVFASSNTKEYCRDSKPIQKVLDDLQQFDIKLATSLDHGYYLVQQSE